MFGDNFFSANVLKNMFLLQMFGENVFMQMF